MTQQPPQPPQFDSPPCAGADPDAWFPETYPSVGSILAIRVCNTCEYAAPCLDYALRVRVDGIWGGTSAIERERMRRRKGIRAIAVDSYTNTTTTRTHHTAA